MDSPLSEQVILTLCATLDKAVSALAKLADSTVGGQLPPPTVQPPAPGINTTLPEDWDPTDWGEPAPGMQLYDNDAPPAEPDNPLGIPGFNWPPRPEDVVS